jgi:hypothetical protein
VYAADEDFDCRRSAGHRHTGDCIPAKRGFWNVNMFLVFYLNTRRRIPDTGGYIISIKYFIAHCRKQVEDMDEKVFERACGRW